ncbi:helix-turn-helix transcriptional regulator [Pantoea agglomerans]
MSAETVKVHRRNIYAKLAINSQSELFSLFLKAQTGT